LTITTPLLVGYRNPPPGANYFKKCFFFPDFIEHQYPKGLQEKNPAHKNFILTLKKFNLIDENLIVKKEAKEGLQSPISNGNGNSNGQSHGKGDSKSMSGEEKFIVPQMCKLWYENFTSYTSDRENDFEGMGKILHFVSRQAKIKDVGEADTQIKILNTLQLVADQVSKEVFWVNKPIKSIANNIQEFYNKIKNPTVNGTKSSTNQQADRHNAVQAELEKRLAQRG